MRKVKRVTLLIWILASSAALGSAYSEGSAQDVEMGNRAKAAKIFDSAMKLYLSGKYSEATAGFLFADEIDPSNAALMSAARAALKGMNYTRAAEISLKLVVRYSDLQTRAFPLETLDNAPEMVCMTRTEVNALERQISTALKYLRDVKNGTPKIPENPF